MRFRENKKKALLYFLGLGFIIVVLGLPSYSLAVNETTSKLTVYVVNYPLKYFAERIAGEHARVVFPAPRDVDPAFWNPDTETVAADAPSEIGDRIVDGVDDELIVGCRWCGRLLL